MEVWIFSHMISKWSAKYSWNFTLLQEDTHHLSIIIFSQSLAARRYFFVYSLMKILVIYDIDQVNLLQFVYLLQVS